MKVHLPQIEQDKSFKKQSSHFRLLALVKEIQEDIASLYKKEELRHLCDANQVNFLVSWNKTQLAKPLVEAIPTYEYIPCHQVTSNYVAELMETDSADRIPVLRLRRL